MGKDEWFFRHGRPAGQVTINLTSLYYNSRNGFRPIPLYWSNKIPTRDPNFNDMQPRFMLANHGIE